VTGVQTCALPILTMSEQEFAALCERIVNGDEEVPL